MTDVSQPDRRSLRRFAWLVAGPREVLIAGTINGVIAWFLFARAETVPLVGEYSVMTMLVPLCFLLPGLSSFFGVLAGALGRKSGMLDPPMEKEVVWLPTAIRLGIQRALLFGLLAIAVSMLWASREVHVSWGGGSVVVGIALFSGAFAYWMHVSAILSTTALRRSSDRSGASGASPEPQEARVVPTGVPEACRVNPGLTNVQETLLLPLYFRAQETLRPDAILRDPKAVEIINSLDYDFSALRPCWNLHMDVATRTEIFDERVREFLQRHPSATVVNLGAGLDGRFLRLDNGRVRWWDLDLPDVIQLRRQFYTPSDRNPFLAKDCFDFGWMDEIRGTSGRALLVLAEGLFMYCDPDQLRALLAELKQRWPGCEIVFQSICPEMVGREDLVRYIASTGATFRWGIHDGRALCQWDPEYQFIGQWHLVDRHRNRWRSIRYRTWWPGYRRWYRQVMKVTQLRLGAPAEGRKNSPSGL